MPGANKGGDGRCPPGSVKRISRCWCRLRFQWFQAGTIQLKTRRTDWRACGDVYSASGSSRARGEPTLKLAVRGEEARNWWMQILEKLTAPPNCHEVESFVAQSAKTMSNRHFKCIVPAQSSRARAAMLMQRVIIAVQPVWWLAPRPRPVSPSKYSWNWT